MDTLITDAYFEWLKARVKRKDKKTYGLLLHRLFQKEFYALLEFDNNRGSDGIDLRKEWANKLGYSSLSLDVLGGCRVFEMLLALASRGTVKVSKKKTGLDESGIFWLMIRNLGLSCYDNNGYAASDDPECEIDEILTRFLDRKYDAHGNGGLFPLAHTNWDQRVVEIWSQMSEYLTENRLF